MKKVRTAARAGPWTVDRDGYLARIDGIVFGDNPEDGVVRGNMFLHPPLRFAIEFPQGWEITNSDEQVVAQEPGNKVFMVLRTIEARPGRSLDQVAQQHMRESGYKATDVDAGDDRRDAGGRRHLRRERVGHRQSDGARRARRPGTNARSSSAGSRRRRCTRACRAISIARFNRSGR